MFALRHLRGFFFGACGACAVASGCRSSGGDASPYVPPPASTLVDDPGPVKIRREVFIVDGVTPPPNPQGNASTPPEQNKVRVVRYRVDADPPKPARAIVVMMPGYLAGAGSFDAIARAVVRRSTDADSLEAWAIDRRANLLEDTFALDVAESRRDPSIARRYYFGLEAVEGKTFAGFLEGSALPWTSEWGIATTVGDLRNVIALVPDAERARRVVLLGHSLGAGVVEEYAAWDFNGAPGYGDLAGLVLADGLAENEGKSTSAVDRATYENGGGSGAPLRNLGVESDIRHGNTFSSLPFLGVSALVVSEYVAMRARWTPTTVEDDTDRDRLLSVALGQTPLPKMTNRAAFGFAFDDDSALIPIIEVACGSANGGTMTPYQGALGGTLQHPSDVSATYGWTEYDKTTPPETTSIDDFARAWYEGPGLNLAEWYFPQRLPVDVSAAGTLNIADDDWRATAYGLRAKHGAAIDVPILAVAFALVHDVSAFDALKAMVAPIGAGRPSAGKGRTDPDAFSTASLPTLTHVEAIAGTDVPGSLVAGWYDRLAAFARKQTPSGGVSVPIRVTTESASAR